MTVIPSKRPFSPGWTDEQGPPRKRRKLSELWHDSPVDADPSLHEVDAAHFASHIEPWKRPLHSYDSNITGSTVIGHRRISSDPFPLLHEGDVRYISHLVRLRKREIEGCNASGGDKAVLDQHLRPLLNQANTDDNRCLEETPGSMGKNQTYPPQDKRDDTQSIIVKKTALPSQNYVISPNSWLGYADQLEGLRDVEETPNMFLRIKELYTDIFRCYENMKGDIYNTTHLRRYFTMNRLIYIPDVRTWVETDMVVWTGKKAGKLGRKRLDCWYGPLQAFFVNALGVPATVSQLAVPPTGKITVKRPRKKATPFVNLPFRRSMGPSPSPTLGSVGVQMPSCQTIPQPRRSVRLQWKALALERDSAKANEKEKDLIEKDQQNPVYDVDFNTSNQPTFSIPICLKKNHLQIEAKHSIPSCDFSGPTITQTPFSFGTAPAISNAISLLQQQRVRQNRHRTGVVSEKYKTLLQFVIERAKISGFPSNLESILWVDCPSMFGYLDGAEVGSAGELFTFEVLSSLNLPGFTWQNWRSAMRNDVSHAHPNYANMAKWTGTETTDIVYHDTTGYLTAMFIDRGYLLPTTEGAGAVTYYFEVKTTMGKHINFHLSRQQRALRKAMNDSGGVGSRVFVIARVFGMGTINLGVKFILGP